MNFRDYFWKIRISNVKESKNRLLSPDSDHAETNRLFTVLRTKPRTFFNIANMISMYAVN